MNKLETNFYNIMKRDHGKKFADWAAAHKPVIDYESFLQTMCERALGWAYTRKLLAFALEPLTQVEN